MLYMPGGKQHRPRPRPVRQRRRGPRGRRSLARAGPARLHPVGHRGARGRLRARRRADRRGFGRGPAISRRDPARRAKARRRRPAGSSASCAIGYNSARAADRADGEGRHRRPPRSCRPPRSAARPRRATRSELPAFRAGSSPPRHARGQAFRRMFVTVLAPSRSLSHRRARSPPPRRRPSTGDLAAVQRAPRSRSQSMTATFSQTDRNGKMLTGTLTLKRPGKIRFQYEKGVPILIVADGGSLYLHRLFGEAGAALADRRTRRSACCSIPTRDITRYRQAGADRRSVDPVGRGERSQASRIWPDHADLRANARRPAGLMLQGWVALDAQNNRTTIRLSEPALQRAGFRRNVPLGRPGAGRVRENNRFRSSGRQVWPD